MQSMYKLSTSQPTSEMEEEPNNISAFDQRSSEDVLLKQAATDGSSKAIGNIVENKMVETVSIEMNKDFITNTQVRL